MAQSVSGSSGQFTIQDPASVTLTNPNSGSVVRGSTLYITWSKSSFTSNVNLYYTTSTTFSTSNAITSNLSGTTLYWTTPYSLAGTNIYIWVAKADDTSVRDRSDSTISITNYTHTKTFSDSLATTDSWTKTNSTWRTYIYRTITDSLSIADTWNLTDRLWKIMRTISDSLSISDTWSKSAYFYRTISDSLSIADTWSKSTSVWRQYFYRTISDSLSIADTWNLTDRLWKIMRTISDSISLSDSWTKTQRKWIKFITAVDSFSIVDSWTKTQRKWIKFITTSDSFSLSDLLTKTQRKWIKFITKDETIALSETPTKSERIWIHFTDVNDSFSMVDLSTETEGVLLSDNLSISDGWSVNTSSPSIGYMLGGNDESIRAKWVTGWISPTDLSKNVIMRRLNMDYISDDDITIKLYCDGDLVNPVATKTFASSSTATHGSIRLGTRVKYFLLSIETAQSTENVKIERIEIEVDD